MTTNDIDTLYDSRTNEPLTPAELGIPEERYDELVEESAALGDGNPGHIIIGETGRRVYASY